MRLQATPPYLGRGRMKKFFQKQAADWRFRKAGAGHRLDEEKPKIQPKKSQPAPHRPSTESSRAAGSAAIARLENQEQRGGGTKSSGAKTRPTSEGSSSKSVGHSPLLHSHQPTQPLQAAASTTSPSLQQQQEVIVADTTSRSVVVHLICPICNRSVPHTELSSHFASCLQEEYLKEPLTSSVQMLYTLCQDQEKRKVCIDTLCKYLDNIIEHPGEEKYRKIRVNNKAFSERVLPVEGAVLFLEAVGFCQQLLPNQDTEEQFYVLPLERVDDLVVHRELLTSTEPLQARVDRNLQVFKPSPRAMHFDLPNAFYNLTVEEIRREQKQRSEAVEREQMLRTRAMRERDEMRNIVRYYRYTLLRIRMPDGLLLQGVFCPLEKLSEVRLFISGALVDPSLTYTLSALGKPLQDSTASLALLGLVPSAVLNMSWEGNVSPLFLLPELLARIQELT